MHQLTAIAFSHYVEKARWALDRFGVEYQERRYLPLLHFAGVLGVHRGGHGLADKASTRFSTPVLQTSDGQILCDSSTIARYVSDRFAPKGHDLYPSAEVTELEAHLSTQLGPHSRRVGYGACFGDPSILRDMARHNVGRLQAGVFIATLPLAVNGLRRALKVEPKYIARSMEKVRLEMDAVSTRLADGRPHLLGDRFTAADITLACMAAPALLPAEYSAWMPPIERTDAEIGHFMRELRATPAGQYALRVFREERRRVIPPNERAPGDVEARP